MTQQTNTQNNDFRDFALVLRAALLMVVRWIEKRYMVKGDCATHTQPVAFVNVTDTMCGNANTISDLRLPQMPTPPTTQGRPRQKA